MPRDIVLGNGRLLVNLDRTLSIRDIFYPMVGWANHVGGHRCRIGIWVSDQDAGQPDGEGQFAWLNDSWEWQIAYEPRALITNCTASHAGMGLRLQVRHAVLPDANVFLQRFALYDATGRDREARVFFGHDLRIDESDIGDTACYRPTLDAIVHYKRDRYFLFSGAVQAGSVLRSPRIWQYACGQKGFRGAEGTWRDAEDGRLSMNAISQGAVDSVQSYALRLPGKGEAVMHAWMTVGESIEEVGRLQEELVSGGEAAAFSRTSRYWAGGTDHIGDLDRLPARVAELARRSVMILRSHCDDGGAIIAATDSDIMETERAHYAYAWPRDGALAALALNRIGHSELSRAFFEFCVRVLPEDRPFLLHKYTPDGHLGASWHPWIDPDGRPETPFQADGTALVLYSMADYLRRHENVVYAKSLYERFAGNAARFLAGYCDPETGLPLQCWDLWEERRGTHIYTTAATCAGLTAAAEMARVVGNELDAAEFEKASESIRDAMIAHLYDSDAGCFVRMAYRDEEGKLKVDRVVDSSAYAVFAFGVLAADDPRVVSTMRMIGKKLWVRAGVGGLARYERDYYFHVTEDFSSVPGNPWIICTLWLADWYIATAKSEADLKSALDLLEWASICSLRTGVLSEQIHPFTLQPLSVAPLIWSHAQYITTTCAYLKRLDELTRR